MGWLNASPQSMDSRGHATWGKCGEERGCGCLRVSQPVPSASSCPRNEPAGHRVPNPAGQQQQPSGIHAAQGQQLGAT